MGKPTGFMDYKRTELALRAPPKKELRIGRKLRRAACRIRKHCAARQRAVWIAVFPFAIAV